MTFLDWLVNRKKSLSAMTRVELRRQELLMEKERNRLLQRVKKLAGDKQDLFERGAAERTPEIRRALAQEFDVETTEQLMLARQLNVRSKELLTVSRLRMLRENHERTRHAGASLGLISEKDLLKLGRLIENDAITSELYQERLDGLLEQGAEVDTGAMALTPAGQAVLDVWDRMDRGVLKDPLEAFDEADRTVRQQHRATDE
jgi:hypothetical protein